jgi:hypothetical protein
VLLRTSERRWEAEALLLFPGPLDRSLGSALRRQQRQSKRLMSGSLSHPHPSYAAHQAPEHLDQEMTKGATPRMRGMMPERWSAPNEAPIRRRRDDPVQHAGKQRGKRLHSIHLEPFSTKHADA